MTEIAIVSARDVAARVLVAYRKNKGLTTYSTVSEEERDVDLMVLALENVHVIPIETMTGSFKPATHGKCELRFDLGNPRKFEIRFELSNLRESRAWLQWFLSNTGGGSA